jgi:hypothetical protein
VPPDRQEHANVLTFLFSLLVQNGQYDLLGDVLADEARVAATDPAAQDETTLMRKYTDGRLQEPGT